MGRGLWFVSNLRYPHELVGAPVVYLFRQCHSEDLHLVGRKRTENHHRIHSNKINQIEGSFSSIQEVDIEIFTLKGNHSRDLGRRLKVCLNYGESKCVLRNRKNILRF